MSHDNDYCIEQINKHLVGGMITGAITSGPDAFGDAFFGFKVKKGKKQFAVWVQQDAEGNGPGWISVEPWEEQKEAG